MLKGEALEKKRMAGKKTDGEGKITDGGKKNGWRGKKTDGEGKKTDGGKKNGWRNFAGTRALLKGEALEKKWMAGKKTDSEILRGRAPC